MAASATPAVRMLVATRRDLPAPIRDALADDPDAKVVKAIAPHPGLSGSRLRAMLVRHGPSMAAQLASNSDAPSDLLEALVALHPARRALAKIAQHPNATPTALLACFPELRARRLAAAHPALPLEALVTLLNDEDPQVARSAASNPSLPPHEMRRLLSHS
ncbi:hypothetical protein AB0J52_13630 [Spirillospora sp. NPDC049652]